MRTSRIALSLGAAAFVLSFVASAGAAPPRGHPTGGHPAGGVAHFAPHVGGGVHFTPHIAASPRFSRRVGVPHFAVRTHIDRLGRPALSGRIHAHRFVGRTPHGNVALHRGIPNVGYHAVPNIARRGAPNAAPVAGGTDPRSFAAHRHLAGLDAFHPFFAHGWHPHGHLGWVGPWFWPYAYGDFFFYALWPYEYAYYDPFWYYGYDDIYEGIFSPYDYQPYVAGAGAPARMSALTQSVAQSCSDEAAEVTGWPIDQIQSALAPNPQQTALLDDLGNAVVKASDVIRAHCPTKLAFAPTDRLAQMKERLEGLVQAVNIVQPPLAKFYNSLSDEQKARFNDIGAPQGKQAAASQQAAQNPQSECTGSPMAFPADRIDRALQPSDAQRAKLNALQAAAAKAADLIKASCPSALPATPPDRLAAEGRHLQAMLQAVQTIRPALDDFYNSLSDEQKAHFNTLGRQLFAQK